MRVLLIGGAGYVGSACLRYLLRQGIDAIALDDLSEGNRQSVPEDRLIVADMLEQGAVANALRKTGAEAVMHFAALASVPKSVADPDSYWRVNVLGTKMVLDAMRETGIKRIIFSSTAATYGFDGEMPLTEDSPQLPQTPYGTTKLAGETMMREYAHAYGIGCCFLRYFNASGADEDGAHGEDRREETHLVPLVLQVAVGRREKVMVFGNDWETRDGTCVRDYVHVEDLAQAHFNALKVLKSGEVRAYCLGSGEGTTVLEVVRACEEVAGTPIRFEFAPRRPGDPAVLVTSSAKAQRELNWSPRFPHMCDIVATAWRWHRSHPTGYRRSSQASLAGAAKSSAARPSMKQKR
jgi:UDP-glucose-4-epimerase GalE